jgi:hypothetical protein
MDQARLIVLEKENEKDIRIVVDRGIKNLEQIRSRLNPPRESPERNGDQNIFSTAKEHLLKNSRGVFLWVTLVLRELETCVVTGGYSMAGLDNRVRSLPKELGGPEGFYRAMVNTLISRHEIGGDQEAPGRRIFAWVTFSTRPLHLSELGDALAVPPWLKERVDLLNFDLDRNRPFDLELGLSSFCGGLVEVKVPTSYSRGGLNKTRVGARIGFQPNGTAYTSNC